MSDKDEFIARAGYEVYETARYIYEYCTDDPSEFCIQHSSPGRTIFGSINRMAWSPLKGFEVIWESCTPKFKERWMEFIGEVVSWY